MEKFTVEKTKFDNVLVLTPRVFSDDRGYFCETYNSLGLSNLNFNVDFVQDNESKSKKNVIRGLHYQWAPAMGKLVRVISGAVIDVVVDIRAKSPTYGEHMKFEITSENKKQIWVPAGFAHGILSLQEDTLVSYKCSAFYNHEGEGGIDPFDEDLNIDWGINSKDAKVSKKDLVAMSFKSYTNNPKF